MFDPGQHPIQRVNRIYAQQTQQINQLRSELEADKQRRTTYIQKLYANDPASMNHLLDELDHAYRIALTPVVLAELME